ncbi:MAG: alpha/beta hydrolase [Bacteroidetes bacterium]|nr:alpha/beta hydrolase [Bacteroidota bacterium]
MSPLYFKKLGSGQAIIFIHGFCETHQIWDGFAEELSTDFSIWCVDLPGFGKSELLGSVTIESVAHRLIQEIEHKKVGPSILVGHSLGGYVALAMQKAKPELFAGLVLFHSTLFADSEEKKINRNKTIDFVKAYGIAPFVETFVPNLFYQKSHPAISTVHAIAMQTPISTLIAYSQAMRDRIAHDHIAGFDLLILAGRYDAIIPLSVSEQMAALSERASLKILEFSGHMGMFEDREECLNAIRDFGFAALFKLND